jgi:hypothetical protein
MAPPTGWDGSERGCHDDGSRCEADGDESPGEALDGCGGHCEVYRCDMTKSVRDESTLSL